MVERIHFCDSGIILMFLIDCECSDAIRSNAFKGTKLIPMLRAPIGMPPLDDVARSDVALYQPLEVKGRSVSQSLSETLLQQSNLSY